MFAAMALQQRLLLIKEMSDTKLVIYSGQTDNWSFKPQKKLPLVNKYIDSNFLKNIQILDWEVRLK